MRGRIFDCPTTSTTCRNARPGVRPDIPPQPGQTRDVTDVLTFHELRDEAYLGSVARLILLLTGETVTISVRNIIISADAAREIA